MKIKKGDMVKIISGNDKGKTGRIIKTFLSKDRILVEGVNIVKKHSRPSQENPQGAILEKELSIHVSNISHIDPKDNKASRTGYKFLKDGRKVRYSKRSGDLVD